MKQGAKTNLRLEAVAGCLFLCFVFLVGLIGLLAANWIGMELVSSMSPKTVTDKIVYSPRAFLAGIAMFLIPSVVVALTIVGIRRILIQPEPPPWTDEGKTHSF